MSTATENPVVATTFKNFVVAIRSTNTNSFGLRQHILVARDGEAHSICLNYMNEKPAGTVVEAKETHFKDGTITTDFPTLEGEVQEKMLDCPANHVGEFWSLVDAGQTCDINSSRQPA